MSQAQITHMVRKLLKKGIEGAPKLHLIVPNRTTESELWHILFGFSTTVWLAVDNQGSVRVGYKKAKTALVTYTYEKPEEDQLRQEVETMLTFVRENERV